MTKLFTFDKVITSNVNMSFSEHSLLVMLARNTCKNVNRWKSMIILQSSDDNTLWGIKEFLAQLCNYTDFIVCLVNVMALGNEIFN